MHKQLESWIKKLDVFEVLIENENDRLWTPLLEVQQSTALNE